MTSTLTRFRFGGGLIGVAFVFAFAACNGARHRNSEEVAQRVTSTTAALPFDLPSTAALRASPKKAFGHYVPALPVSIDNKDPAHDYWALDYLDPMGEHGVHMAYGGYTRDRPMPRPVRPEANWRLLDMQDEVRQAVSVGLDGFTLVLYSTGGSVWDNSVLMMEAAASDPGFKIILMPDMSEKSSISTATPEILAQHIAALAAYPSAYHLPDGRLVVSPFKAESHDPAWWTLWMNVMQNTYGVRVALWPCFLDDIKFRDAFASISYGMSDWGARSPLDNDPTLTNPTSRVGRALEVKKLDGVDGPGHKLKWMQPISVQDSRPREGLFDEAENTHNLRNTWEIARLQDADFVQLTTWGDYPELSTFANSPMHGFSWLDISSYFMTAWKLGAPPLIVRDVIYLTHRQHPISAVPTFPETLLMHVRATSGSPRDTIEVLSFLTAPATVRVQAGAQLYNCPAVGGLNVCTQPLVTGSLSAQVIRNGFAVAGVTSPHHVTATPNVQDMQYVAVSSGREGDVIIAHPEVTLRASAVAGTCVNEGAPSINYGTSWSLASRGVGGYIAYLRFDIPAAPPNTQLKRAALQITSTMLAFAGSTDTQTLRLASNDWSETAVTWSSRPPASATILGVGTASRGPNVRSSFPLVTSAVTPLLGTQQSLAVTSTGLDSLWFWSHEAVSSSRPQLILTFQ